MCLQEVFNRIAAERVIQEIATACVSTPRAGICPAIGVGVGRDNQERRTERLHLNPEICSEIVVNVPIEQAENTDRDDRSKQVAFRMLDHVIVDQRAPQRGKIHCCGTTCP